MDVVWSRAARRDFDAIWTGIEAKSPARANRTGRLILTAAAKLGTMPRLGRPGRAAGTRELVVIRTPYLIVYTVGAAQVSIVRVLHGAMRWPADDA
jgi:plasmid stabilization system protein ParE